LIGKETPKPTLNTLFLIATDAVIAVHLAFILFAVLGGVLVGRWPRLAWLHLPACCWAAAIEFWGGTCPLTPLENWLRERGGAVGYETGFIEHYLLPLIYPAALTREVQIVLGLLVVAINLSLYGWLLHRRR
jgi:hypothetical protein